MQISHRLDVDLGYSSRFLIMPLSSWKAGLSSVLAGAEYMILNTNDGMSIAMQMLRRILSPSPSNVELLFRLLQLGVDPNLRIWYKSDNKVNLLREVMREAWLLRLIHDDQATADHSQLDIVKEKPFGFRSFDVDLLNMLYYLICFGDDIFSIDPSDFDQNWSWYRLTNPLRFAYLYGVSREFDTALEENGYNPYEMRRDSDRNCRDA